MLIKCTGQLAPQKPVSFPSLGRANVLNRRCPCRSFNLFRAKQWGRSSDCASSSPDHKLHCSEAQWGNSPQAPRLPCRHQTCREPWSQLPGSSGWGNGRTGLLSPPSFSLINLSLIRNAIFNYHHSPLEMWWKLTLQGSGVPLCYNSCKLPRWLIWALPTPREARSPWGAAMSNESSASWDGAHVFKISLNKRIWDNESLALNLVCQMVPRERLGLTWHSRQP